jgi:uncharacterized protein (DUF58 family)
MTSLANTPAPTPFAFNGVVRLTRIGTTYVIFTIVIGFAALNTGNNALYIGLTFMLGALLLSGVASKGGLKHLRLTVMDVGEAWAGQPVDAMIRVENRSIIWNVRDVVITAADVAQPLVIPLLPRKEETLVAVPFVFNRRGRVELRKIDLYTRYPFGFTIKKRRVPLHGDLVVFPRLLDIDVARERFRPSVGEQTTANRLGPGSEIHSLREFVRGDSLRLVHWKKSASLGRWIIKQTDQDAAHTVHVVLDPYLPPGVAEDQFENLVSMAATFIHQALKGGMDVELEMPRVTLRSKDGQAAHSLFRALALVEPIRERVDQFVTADSVFFTLRRSELV